MVGGKNFESRLTSPESAKPDDENGDLEEPNIREYGMRCRSFRQVDTTHASRRRKLRNHACASKWPCPKKPMALPIKGSFDIST